MQLIKQFITYSAGAVILKIITALSMLITIKFITPAEFGCLALVSNLIIFMPIILGLGLRQVLAVEFFGKQHYWITIWHLSLIYISFAMPVCVLLLWNLDYLNQILFLNQLDHNLLILAILISLLNFWPELLFQLLRFQKQALRLTIIQIGMGAMLAIITIGLLYLSKLQIASILTAQLITQGIVSIYFAYLLLQNQDYLYLPSAKIICNYLKIGLPFVPNILFAWLILACNRWLINWQLNLTEVGIYSLGENISIIFQTLITQPLMHSFLPHAFAKFTTQPNQIAQLDYKYQKIAILFSLFFIVTIPISFLILKPILCWLLPSKYLQAIPLLMPLLLAQAIFTSTYISSASLQYLKKTHLLAIFMGLSALIAILINLWLIPTYGIYSCPIATNCAYLTYLVSIYLVKRYIFAL